MTYSVSSGTLNPAPSLAVQGRSDRHAKWRSITYAVDNVTVVVVNIPHGVSASFTVRHAGTAAIPSVLDTSHTCCSTDADCWWEQITILLYLFFDLCATECTFSANKDYQYCVQVWIRNYNVNKVVNSFSNLSSPKNSINCQRLSVKARFQYAIQLASSSLAK